MASRKQKRLVANSLYKVFGNTHISGTFKSNGKMKVDMSARRAARIRYKSKPAGINTVVEYYTKLLDNAQIELFIMPDN